LYEVTVTESALAGGVQGTRAPFGARLIGEES
jgi:hypothetical protein